MSITVSTLLEHWTLDSWSVVTGLGCVMLRWGQQGWRIHKDECVFAFLNGTTIAPFVVLAISAFSPGMLALAMTTKGAMAMAGCVGLFFVLSETLAPKGLRRKSAEPV